MQIPKLNRSVKVMRIEPHIVDETHLAARVVDAKPTVFEEGATYFVLNGHPAVFFAPGSEFSRYADHYGATNPSLEVDAARYDAASLTPHHPVSYAGQVIETEGGDRYVIDAKLNFHDMTPQHTQPFSIDRLAGLATRDLAGVGQVFGSRGADGEMLPAREFEHSRATLATYIDAHGVPLEEGVHVAATRFKADPHAAKYHIGTIVGDRIATIRPAEKADLLQLP